MEEPTTGGADFWDALKNGRKNVSWETEKELQAMNGKLSARGALVKLNMLNAEINWLQSILASKPEDTTLDSLEKVLLEQLNKRVEKKRRLVTALDATVVEYSE